MNVYQYISSDLKRRGGILKCERCGKERKLGNVSGYLKNGWPECHGLTMTWITQDQLNEQAEAIE